MKFTSLYEKFMVAVDVLATSPASLQKRLEGAYRSFIDIEPEDFDDDEMQATFEQIRSRLTRVQQGQFDAIAATCRQMSDQEAAEVADFIFSLFLRIAEKHHSSF
jgi:ABC-type amino acid transport substrate-binding protein